MQRSLVLTLAAAISLAGCSGQGGNVTAAATADSQTPSTQSSTLRPYAIPVRGTAPENEARNTQTSLGGIPNSISGAIMDTPSFNPGDQVDLAITQVDVIASGAVKTLTKYKTPTVVNLLDYQKSAFNLGSNTLPPARYDAVRIHLAPFASKVVTGGRTYIMLFGMTDPTTGLFKPNMNSDVTFDMPAPIDNTTGATSFVIDFSVMESISLVGRTALVTPALHAVRGSNAAEITGTVVSRKGSMTNLVVNAVVAAMASDGTVAATSATNAAGNFDLHGMPGGSYKLRIYNNYTTTSGQTITATGTSNKKTYVDGPDVNVPAGMSEDVQQINDN